MGLKNTRAGNYPEWYQNVVSEADMAENSSSPGCMVIKPWGYGIWERIRDVFDEKIKETEHENCYFPMFIPLSFFQKEAEHVDGFAKEMAVVTHSRLSMKDGKLTPDSKLEEPLIVRPTSEAIIADSFSKWVKSYRDLPVPTPPKPKRKPSACWRLIAICAKTRWQCRCWSAASRNMKNSPEPLTPTAWKP